VQRAHLILQGQAEGLSHRLEDQARLIQELKHQGAQAQQNLEHYRESVRQQRAEERIDFERQLRYGEQALKESREENQALRATNSRLDKAALQWQSECERQQAEGAALVEKLGTLEQTMAQLHQQLAIGEGRYQVLAQAHQQTTIKLQTQEQTFLEQEKAAAVVQEKLKTLSTTLQKAKDHNVWLQNENQILAQEKAHLEGQCKQLQHPFKSL
jgi:chromosome segregation ATPase